MNSPATSIGKLYCESPAASTLLASRRCLACPIEEIALTPLPRAKVPAAGAARWGQRTCAAVAGHYYLGQRALRPGLLAVAALCAWQAAAGQAVPVPTARPETVVVRGVVLDDSLNVPVPGLFLYLNDTKYGAITDAQGAFAFNFPTGWKPVRSGMLSIKAATIPFTFKPLRVQLNWHDYDPAHPLTLRLASAPGRGRPNLHGSILMAPPVPPPVYPPQSHTARP